MGTVNLFIHFEPKAGHGHVEVTDTRTSVDFAAQMKALVDERHPEAERIRVVMDNLNTHTGAALYEAYEPAEARRILDRLEFRYTPKHGSSMIIQHAQPGGDRVERTLWAVPGQAHPGQANAQS